MNLEQQTGMTAQDLDLIAQAARQQPETERRLLFGSRAKGQHRKGSDVDLAVQGDRVTDDSITTLADQLNEVRPLPYLFDVVDYNQGTHRQGGCSTLPALKSQAARRAA